MSLASYRAALSRDNYMAEKKGFEPLRRFRPPGFQDQSLQPDLGISPFPSLKEQIDYITLKKIKSTKEEESVGQKIQRTIKKFKKIK